MIICHICIVPCIKLQGERLEHAVIVRKITRLSLANPRSTQQLPTMMPHAIEQTAQDIKPSMEKTNTEKSFSSDGTYSPATPPNVWRSWGFDMIICAGGLVSFLSESL